MQNLSSWIASRHSNINHRQLLVIQGDESWCWQHAQTVLSGDLSTLWVNPPLSFEMSEPCINDNRYSHFLGQEYHYLVYNAHNSCRANALMALNGTVTRGGVMLLLIPDTQQWTQPTTTHYAQHWLYSMLLNTPDTQWIKQTDTEQLVPIEQTNKPDLNQQAIESDQQLVVDAIIKVAQGKRNVPLVLTADRGRGKTSVLGMASALLLQSDLNIIITAPSPKTVSNAFKHCKQLLINLQDCSDHEYHYESTKITKYLPHTNQSFSYEFVAIDRLIAEKPKANLVIIDEAAAVPTAILQKIITSYHRLVFSTTLHGYEGSGRGFELRFLPKLQQCYPKTKRVSLTQPIRWFNHDPLEAFWFECFLCHDLTQSTINNQQVAIADRDQLIPADGGNDEDITLIPFDHKCALSQRENLHRAFSLLVNAHYQTTPDDLWRILQGEHQLVMAYKDNRLVGAVVGCYEGTFKDSELSESILAGKRRCHGHLLPQNLALHYQHQTLLSCRYFRVIRIAVQPNLQRQGFGHKILKQLPQHIGDTDIIGSAFSATAELLQFWLSNGYRLVRVGTRKDAASGEHSVIVLKSENTSSQALISRVENMFQQDFGALLTLSYRHLESALLALILRQWHDNQSIPSRYLDQLRHFAYGGSHETAMPAIHFIITKTDCWHDLPLSAQTLLIDSILLALPMDEIRDKYQLSGAKQWQQQLRNTINTLIADKSNALTNVK